MKTMKNQPPKGLSRAMSAWWRRVIADYDLESHHRLLLEEAARAWDRTREARKILDAEGLMATDRFGQRTQHPLVIAERQSRQQWAALLKQLDLDGDEDAGSVGRKPGFSPQPKQRRAAYGT